MKSVIAALFLTTALSSCAVYPTYDGGVVVTPLPPPVPYYETSYDAKNPWRPYRLYGPRYRRYYDYHNY